MKYLLITLLFLNSLTANENINLNGILIHDLQNGVMTSILIGSKVKPILNLDAIKSSKITLRPVLLKISEIYKKEEI